MEKYPLILEGEEAGAVTVRREGGWTLFDVCCAMRPGIVRVSVYGEGREGYLGVLAPEGDGLALHRRMSRSALRGFPEVIAYAGMAGKPAAAEDAEKPETEAPKDADEAPAPEAEAPLPEPEPEGPEPEPETKEHPPEPAAEGAAEPEAPPEKETAPPELEDVYWYASPDGALVCFDGTQNLIALPLGDERLPDGDGGWRQTIEGRDYVVFRTKDGRLLR